MDAHRIAVHLAAWLPLASVVAQAPDFVRDVAPLLQQRCVSCHGPDKQKGKLRLDARAHVFDADHDEKPIVPKDPGASELIRRIELPAGDDDIMPNEGDPLSQEQISMLRRWVEAGAEWPAEGDEYFAAKHAAARVPKLDFGIAAPAAEAQAKIDATLAALGEVGAVAQRVAADTPAVDVNASLVGKAFDDASLRRLGDLDSVLVWLNLARTGIGDSGLAALAGMGELRRLSVANTQIGDDGIAALGALPKVEVLNVYGTKVTDATLTALQSWPALKKVYAFDTAITAAAAERFAAARPGVLLDRGDYAEERLRAAEAEIAERERANAPVNTLCPVTGEAVKKEQTVVHDGVRIAFCCDKCKAKFTKDPAPFAEKIAEFKAAAERAKQK